MTEHVIQCDLPGDRTVHAGHTLDEPLELTDARATVPDEETALELARRHTHLEYVGPAEDAPDADAEGVDSEEICGAEMSDGSTCERPASECPYHGD